MVGDAASVADLLPVNVSFWDLADELVFKGGPDLLNINSSALGHLLT